MRYKQYEKLLTIALSNKIYDYAKNESEKRRISIGEWFREAATSKIESDQTLTKNGGI